MLLIHCKPENVERLARALKMPLPLPGPQYERRLRRALLAALETDRRRAAAEEQRMKDKAEALKVAVEIAQALGETGERPIAQIRRIVGLMGAEWARDALRGSAQVVRQPDGGHQCHEGRQAPHAWRRVLRGLPAHRVKPRPVRWHHAARLLPSVHGPPQEATAGACADPQAQGGTEARPACGEGKGAGQAGQ